SLSRVVGNEFERIRKHEPEKGAEKIKNLLEEPDVHLFRPHAREVHVGMKAPRAQHVAAFAAVRQKIVESFKHRSRLLPSHVWEENKKGRSLDENGLLKIFS